MKKTFVPLLLAAALLPAVSAQWVAAQESIAEEREIAPIALPFDATTDGPAFIPSDLNQSDLPYNPSDKRALIGNEDRQAVLTRAFPWSAIGRLEMIGDNGRYSSHCTATLIARDVVLTNSHCLIDEDTERPFRRPIVFKPSMIEGVSLDKATVIDYDYGWKTHPNDPAHDWAILKLDQPLGDIYGHMGWRNLDFSSPRTRAAAEEKLRTAGYSGDFPTRRNLGNPGETAGAVEKCSVVGTQPGLLFHDCDTNPGASGSPIFALFDDNRYYIVGLHAGSNKLSETMRFPDGQRAAVVNRGVQVSQWASRATAMVR